MRMGSGEGSTMTKFIVLYHAPNIIKYRRLRWAGHIDRIEEGKFIGQLGRPGMEVQC